MTLIVMEAMFSAPVDGEDTPWTQAYDFDGDSKNDTIEVMFTGGAHCCYGLTVRLSATGTIYRVPFELDGGYVGGLDLSQPHRFTICTSPNGVPEFIMQIATYNGVEQPLPSVWTQLYGIRSHYIGVSFVHGHMQVRDVALDNCQSGSQVRCIPCTKP
jgi:hypothetical protein